MDGRNDRVSVVLPVYNAELTLKTAIDSILAQSYSDFELIILDDGSNDTSLEIIEYCAARDSRIRFSTRENKGLACTLNELIESCNNDIVFRMDADDFSYRDRIASQLNFLKDNPHVVMVGGQIDFFSGDNRCETFEMPTDHDSIVQGLAQGRFPICHPAVAFRRHVAIECGLYSVSFAGEDLDFFLKMSERGNIANITDKVLSYRISLNSLSVRKYAILSQAYSFALVNYARRKQGEGELSWEEYETVWSKRNLFERVPIYLYGWSERFYRYYLMCKVNKQRRSIVFLFLASCFRPKTVFTRINELLWRRKK